MLRKFLVSTYLLLYVLSILWMIALVLTRVDSSGFLNKVMLVSGSSAGTLLCVSAFNLLAKKWKSAAAIWIAMIVWLSFLTWFLWFSNDSPLIQHEVHTFDPTEMAIESHHFKVNAIITFLALLFWFLGYAFVWLSRTRRTTSFPSK